LESSLDPFLHPTWPYGSVLLSQSHPWNLASHPHPTTVVSKLHELLLGHQSPCNLSSALITFDVLDLKPEGSYYHITQNLSPKWLPSHPKQKPSPLLPALLPLHSKPCCIPTVSDTQCPFPLQGLYLLLPLPGTLFPQRPIWLSSHLLQVFPQTLCSELVPHHLTYWSLLSSTAHVPIT
jgi:hypothetical protein